MGNFEVIHYWWVSLILALVIISILSFISYKNILIRFGILKKTRKDFYECGFQPTKQTPIQISMQFLIICIFFIIYDIELIFSFPFFSSITYNNFLNLNGFILIYLTMIISIYYDFDKNLLDWKFL